jgi:hypothetical protein
MSTNYSSVIKYNDGFLTHPTKFPRLSFSSGSESYRNCGGAVLEMFMGK